MSPGSGGGSRMSKGWDANKGCASLVDGADGSVGGADRETLVEDFGASDEPAWAIGEGTSRSEC